MVSNGVVISFYTILVALITVPIMLAVLMKIKTKIKISPFLLGMLSYFTFAVVCVAFVNIIFVNKGRPTAEFINGNIAVYSLYFAVVTGILEELGIFVVFKKIIHAQDDKRTPLMYGLGHAGLEAFLITGPAMFVYITCATAINELGIDGFMTQWSDIEKFDLQEVVDVLTGMSITDVLLMGGERLMYFVMQLFLSVLVFYSVKRETKVYFWIAVIIRGLCTVPGSIKNFGSYTGETTETIILLIYTLLVIGFAGFMAFKLYKNYDKEQVLMPADLFSKKPKTYL